MIERSKTVPEEEDAVLTLPPEPFPESPFAPNRRLLNEALLNLRRKQLVSSTADRKATGSKRKAVDTIACSAVKWARVEDVYGDWICLDDDAFPCQEFKDADVAATIEALKSQQEIFGPCVEQKEQRRKMGIATIMIGAAKLLNDKAVQVRVEVPMKSAAVFSNGVADMLVSRNKKCKLLVVEAKKEDFDQGKAQDLVLMDVAIAENERLGVKVTPVFGIVSNFLEWHFYRYNADGIKFTLAQINEVRSLESDVKKFVAGV